MTYKSTVSRFCWCSSESSGTWTLNTDLWLYKGFVFDVFDDDAKYVLSLGALFLSTQRSVFVLFKNRRITELSSLEATVVIF